MSKLKIGLEIHGYLTTKEKLFCNCKASHKDQDIAPNTLICPVCTAQPGCKPMPPNQEAIKKLLQIGLMLNCKINHLPKKLTWYRKHYNWPDLPKGYQNTISGTYATHPAEKGEFLGIGITEVHLEEDPAAWNPEKGTIDYNRSGLPLVEIVTDPDFKTSSQVEIWLKQMILTMSYIKALNPNAGIKADVNVSYGGERVEIKNINSIQEIVNAIEYESKKQQKNPAKERETLRWDPEKQQTIKMRSKESHADYRFIKDPDLPVIQITKQEVQKIKSKLPESPMQKLDKIIKKHKLSDYDAKVLTQNLEIVEFFETITNSAKSKIPISLILRYTTTELLGTLNYNKTTLDKVNLNPTHFTQLLDLINNKTITELKAKEILRQWVPNKVSKPINTSSLKTLSSANDLKGIITKVLVDNTKAVEDYRSGNKVTINFLIGQVMKLSNKQADYRTAKEMLEKEMK
jgi:aspartyl-tRNA(Asn)/glutamyl-tRNA(Gln) amidotransferase subunit B